MAAHRAAMELFDQAGMDALRTKSLALTGLLEELLQIQPGKFHIIALQIRQTRVPAEHPLGAVADSCLTD